MIRPKGIDALLRAMMSNAWAELSEYQASIAEMQSRLERSERTIAEARSSLREANEFLSADKSSGIFA